MDLMRKVVKKMKFEGLSQKALGAILCENAASISRWKNRYSEPSLPQREKLRDYLEGSVILKINYYMDFDLI